MLLPFKRKFAVVDIIMIFSFFLGIGVFGNSFFPYVFFSLLFVWAAACVYIGRDKLIVAVLSVVLLLAGIAVFVN